MIVAACAERPRSGVDGKAQIAVKGTGRRSGSRRCRHGLPAPAGTTSTVVVDGYSNDELKRFTLTVTPPP
jgi:hypothetical protein